MKRLARRRNAETEAWWTRALEDDAAPLIVRELMREREVLASEVEIEDALVWARTLAEWDEEHPPLAADDEGL